MNEIEDAFIQTMVVTLVVWLAVCFLDDGGKIFYWASWIASIVGIICALGAIWIGVL